MSEKDLCRPAFVEVITLACTFVHVIDTMHVLDSDICTVMWNVNSIAHSILVQ